jgi:release factor glutamine methyltransferase
MTEKSRDLLAEAAEVLATAGVASPANDAAILLAHVLGISRGQLMLVDDVSDDDNAAFGSLIGRRARREPLQHLTGSAGFRYVDLAVGPGVFVPRPETELLAGWAIEQARLVENPVVVDLCTGSGAIALSIINEVPNASVHAVELDPGAFEWATRNLSGSGIDLQLGDMADAFPELDGTVDVVVCNPPYIPLEAFESVAAEARDHDPALALWSGDDGLDEIKVVAATAARLLKPGGWFACEHADVQGESAPAVFTTTGSFTEVRDQLDLSGRHRFTTGRRI